MLLIYMLYTVVRYNIGALFSIRVVLIRVVLVLELSYTGQCQPRASKHLLMQTITVRVYWPHSMSAVYNVDLFDLL